MPIYQVTPLSTNSDAVRQTITKNIPELGRLELVNDMGWLVQYNGTTIELSNLLEVTGQEQGEKSPIGPTLITAVSSYFGRGPADMWDWLKIRFESA